MNTFLMLDILNQDIQFLPGVGPRRKALLEKERGIKTYEDLLEYYPFDFYDRSRVFRINELSPDTQSVQIKAKILSFETFDMGPHRTRLVAHVSDGSGVADIVWFSGAKYILGRFKVGIPYIIFGKPTVFNGRFQFSHPDIDPVSELQLSQAGLQPRYSTSEKMKNAGMNSRAVERLVKTLLDSIKEPLPETIPSFITRRLNLISRDEAFRKIHSPKNNDDIIQARHRLKFEELFYVQLNIQRYANDHRRKYRGYVFTKVGKTFNDFYYNNLPFELTKAQERVIREIWEDMRSGRQMNRLLQGDVGSGKTLVALMSMLIAIDNGFQACIMAPTEILAEQHAATIASFLHGMDVRTELLTGMVKGKRRREVLEGLADGSVKILIGTHAVIEDSVQFARLGFVVIDEQHRFGVVQRAKLWNKSDNPPHILVMTATPIPRTLAMTVYGDLDVSKIDELPPGRKPVVTLHKYEDQMASLYAGIRRQLNAGRQAYIVFPLIKESEKIDLKNLEEGYETLREAFPEFRLGKVHGQMKPAEKEEEMRRFASGETHILVATTVIEVGVNVPNASIMVIINAERFGLSQLHQLRGRVGRGAEQSFCILVSKRKLTDETRKRLDIMCETNDGFSIAEADLKLRGPGDLEGTQQSGIAIELKIANLAKDGELIQLAHEEVKKIINDDPMCQKAEYSMLWQRLAAMRKNLQYFGAIS